MTTLTLDQAKKIILSAPNSYKASVALSKAGFVVEKIIDSYILMVDGHEVIFDNSPTFNVVYVIVDGVPLPSPFFLEPQQQPTDTVPAVSTAVEAHPLAPSVAVPLIEDDSPTFKFLVSIMPITDLGGVFQDSDYEHSVYNRLLAQAAYLSQQIGRPATVYDLSLACVLSAIKAVSGEIQPELTVFCPSCDYHSATAQKASEADCYHVNCSQCGLDGDREKVFLSPSEQQAFSPAQ